MILSGAFCLESR